MLLDFYNSVWNKGQLPANWKEATISPLLKADKSPFDVTSYRPVALTSTLCKVMEKMVSTRLRWWLEANQLFNKFQSGFLKHRSTTDHILRLANDAHKAVHTKQCTLAVMLDLEKAFDLVWHRGLLYKMETLGLKGNILQFVSDFLTNRSIRVRIGSAISRPYQLENGTPQGSVISPFLFLIMVNDLEVPDDNVQLSLYADDSAAWKSGTNIDALSRSIQRYLDRLVIYFEQWGFKLSPEKTVAIVFTRSKKIQPADVKLLVGDKVIKVEKAVKFLGVIFDQQMSWKSHIDYVADRCNKRLNLMRVMSGARWGASKGVLLIVYKALIRSLIDYGCIAYDTASDTVKAKLNVIQAKAMRICCGAMVGSPTSAVQVECGQPPLALRRLRMAVDYAVKVKSSPDHPAASTLVDSWENHYGRYQAGREPFGVKVDKALKEAHINDIPPGPKCPAPWTEAPLPSRLPHLRPLRSEVKKFVTDQWQDQWDYSETGQFYYDLQPVVGYKVKQQLQPRQKDVQLTRLRLGHVCLGEKLHEIGQRLDPNCSSCNEPEDVFHFIMECQAQRELQDSLRSQCQRSGKAFHIRTILSSESCADIIYNFLKQRGLFL